MIVSLYIGNKRLDLFEDELINLNNSILDIQDLSKNKTEFTKTFTVPASANNNSIFKHYYDANVNNSFDARTKVDGFIKLSGILFKKGSYRLHEVKRKNGIPTSYTINFWGKLVSLKDTFRDDKLNVLDFSDLDFEYNDTNVIDGLKGDLLNKDIVFSLFMPDKQLFYDSVTDGSNDISTNIAIKGVDWKRPMASIKLIKIIEAIEDYYNIAFSRDLFARSEFTELYMLLSEGLKDYQLGEKKSIEVDFDSGNDTYVNLTTNTITLYQDTSLEYESFIVKLILSPEPAFSTVNYNIKIYRDGDLVSNIPAIGEIDVSFSISIFSYGSNCKVEVESYSEFQFETSLIIIRKYIEDDFDFPGIEIENYITTSSVQTIENPDYLISENIPQMKVIDFFNGMLKAFKGVVFTNEDGSIYVNTVNDYYAEGNITDVTKYIDFKKDSVKRGSIYNTISYKFQEPQTILSTQFKSNTGDSYGDEEAFIYDEDGKLIDGESQEIELPFEQVVYERLSDLNGGITQIQYAPLFNENRDIVKVKPHIHYAPIKYLDDDNYPKIIKSNNDKQTLEQIVTMSYEDVLTNDSDISNSFLFGAEFSTYTYGLLEVNLYTNYHQSYINTVFSSKKREYVYNAILPLNRLLDLSLNDALIIRGQYYRILSYDVELTKGTVKLNLINVINESVVPLTPQDKTYNTNFEESSTTYYITKSVPYTFNLIDTGDGNTWFSASQLGNNVIVNVDRNLGLSRFGKIEVTDGVDVIFNIFINQSITKVTADLNTITADNNTITADNG